MGRAFMHVLIPGLHTHTHTQAGQLAASFHNHNTDCDLHRKRGKQATCECAAIFIPPVVHLPHFAPNSRAESKHYSSTSVPHSSSPAPFILPLLISSLPPLTSLLAYQNEVRDDCSPWLCLSAWVNHGNGKVQTGGVGGHGFLRFILLDAFFLKSLTGPKLKKKKNPKVPDLVSFPHPPR